MNGPWTPERLQDRFAAIDQRLGDLQHDVRVVMPLVGQVGGVQADVDAVESALSDVRGDLRALQRDMTAAVQRSDQTANDVIRAGRAENLKLIGIVVGAFTTLSGAVIAAFATGKL